MTLGEKLTQARKAAGLTQADVAARLNVSRQAVSRWESRQSKPSTERLLALVELYGIAIDLLLNTGSAEKPVAETVSAPPEVELTEPLIPEKRRTRAWLKYAAVALCDALLMLVVVLLLKKSELPEDTNSEQITEVKYNNISGAPFGEPFDLT